MEPFNSNNQAKYLTLIQTAQKLSVSVDVLLQWNEFNILKPTITQRGQIAYGVDQIEKFLEAQQLIQNKKPEVEYEYSQKSPDFISEPHNFSHIDLSLTPKRKRNRLMTEFFGLTRDNLVPISAAVSLSVVLIMMISVIPFPFATSKTVAQNKVQSPQKTVDSNNFATSQSEKSAFSQPTPLLAQNKDTSSITNYSAGLKAKENKPLTLNDPSVDQGQVLGSKSDQDTQIINPKLDAIGYSEIAKFSGNNSNSNNMFDDSGNIKGDAPSTDVLGLALGIGKIVHIDSAAKPPSNFDYISMLLIIITAAAIFILKKFPYSFNANSSTPSNHISSGSHSHKVFEVDQKTDGTVVLYYQGTTYRLSKPELDSESDQFIEKLMEISNPDIQEVDFDKSSDENVRLSTPLSKLVTRLGFVGMKRDLFFPRTTKNKVLFRRFITEQDLQAMNLNANEILKEITQ